MKTRVRAPGTGAGGGRSQQGRAVRSVGALALEIVSRLAHQAASPAAPGMQHRRAAAARRLVYAEGHGGSGPHWAGGRGHAPRRAHTHTGSSGEEQEQGAATATAPHAKHMYAQDQDLESPCGQAAAAP